MQFLEKNVVPPVGAKEENWGGAFTSCHVWGGEINFLPERITHTWEIQ